MAYLSPDELRAVLSPDADSTDTGSAASMSDTELQVAIDDAQDEVDARLAARVTTPIVTPPKIVVDVATDIAAWLATLTDRRGDPISPTDPVQLRYVRAQLNLERLVRGDIPLPTATVQDNPATVAQVENQYDGQMLGPRDAGMSRLGSTWVPGGSAWPYGDWGRSG